MDTSHTHTLTYSFALPPSFSPFLPPPSPPLLSLSLCLSSIVWLQRRREELVERLRGGQKREEAHDLQIGRLKQDRVRVPRTEGEEVRWREGGRKGRGSGWGEKGEDVIGREGGRERGQQVEYLNQCFQRLLLHPHLRCDLGVKVTLISPCDVNE